MLYVKVIDQDGNLIENAEVIRFNENKDTVRFTRDFYFDCDLNRIPVKGPNDSINQLHPLACDSQVFRSYSPTSHRWPWHGQEGGLPMICVSAAGFSDLVLYDLFLYNSKEARRPHDTLCYQLTAPFLKVTLYRKSTSFEIGNGTYLFHQFIVKDRWLYKDSMTADINDYLKGVEERGSLSPHQVVVDAEVSKGNDSLYFLVLPGLKSSCKYAIKKTGGPIVKQGEIQENNPLELSSFGSGNYILEIRDENNLLLLKKRFEVP